MPAEPIYTLIHASDPHLWFRSDDFSTNIAVIDPLPDPFTDFGDPLYEAAHWPSLQSVSNEIEGLLRSRAATCIFSGDLCTEPLSISSLTHAYSFFSGTVRHREYEAGIPSMLRDRVALLLGNHDTFVYWNDGHYSLSPFATHGGSLVAPIRVRPVPTAPGHRWLILFLVRTDWLGATGRFGPLRIARDWWDAEARLRAEHRVLGAGQRIGSSITAPEYARALKILVIHHTPLERADYRSLMHRRRQYALLQLLGRARLLQVVKEIGIHVVLCGHTHEQQVQLKTGTVYADAGTAAAARPDDLPRGFTHAFNVLELTADDELTIRQFHATRQTRGFVEHRADTFQIGDRGLA